MPNSEFKKFGGWKPFKLPVPIPAARWDADPKLSICVNEEWVAYLNGALYSLYKDQTWDSTVDADLADVHYQVSDLVSSWTDCVLPGTGPNWYPQITFGSDTLLYSSYFPKTEPYTETADYCWIMALIKSGEFPVAPLDIFVNFKSIPGNSLVGVNVYEFAAISVLSGGTMHVAATTCLDVVLTADVANECLLTTLTGGPNHADLKQIEITNDGGPMLVFCRGNGDWVCGPT